MRPALARFLETRRHAPVVKRARDYGKGRRPTDLARRASMSGGRLPANVILTTFWIIASVLRLVPRRAHPPA
jgi:hypothetical protein